MKLEDLKRKMSELDKTLAKTDTDIKINAKASKTAQSKLLDKYRIIYTSSLFITAVYAIMILAGWTPKNFPMELNIALDLFSLFSGIWYAYLYHKLKQIEIAFLTPSELLAKTGQVRKLTRCGQLLIVIGFVVFDEFLWRINRDAVWIMGIPIGLLVLYTLKTYWPEYEKLFKEMNSPE